MNYDKTQAVLAKIAEKGSVYGLEGIGKLLEMLDNPQETLQFVHVAGTNGKGSVIAYLAGVLTQAGYMTGQFTSPAVFDRRESICINGTRISEEDYTVCMDRIFKCIDEIKKSNDREPTAFEIETALAFMYFKMKKCDIVLLETGLGGDADATNIIENNLCSVIMPVSFDHTNILGNSLAEIAFHKAGIIKEQCPVVSSFQKEEVTEVLKIAAEQKQSELIFPSEYKIIENKKNIVFDSDFCQKFIYNGKEYEIVLPGRHQIENAVTAIEVVGVLRKKGYTIPESCLIRGLRNTEWKGRFTLINSKPYIIIDGAHNVSAADALRDMIEEYIFQSEFFDDNSKLIMIAGMLSDKDYEEVIPVAAGKCTRLFTVNTRLNSRGLSGKVLQEVARKNNIDVEYSSSVESAVDNAVGMSADNDVILAFGSFTFLAELKEYVEALNKIDLYNNRKE